jgi:3-isopropylmalate/(R)-2-methylmalate dehydratase small subunit
LQAFVEEKGIIAPLPLTNIDTDIIMPKQFLKTVTRDGLARGVLHDLRFDEHGQARIEFILNRPGFATTRFLLAGANFGCGSSREHAVWGLQQFGIRAIIAESFGAIFFDNCQRNGILLVELPKSRMEELFTLVGEGTPTTAVINLPLQRIMIGTAEFLFEIDARRRQLLLDGTDAISDTLQYAEEIQRFTQNYLADKPWRTEF